MKNSLAVLILILSVKVRAESYPDTYRYQILPTDKTTSTVSEASFKKIPETIAALYQKELKEKGLSIAVRPDWQKPFFSAWSNRESDKLYSLNFWGGLSRIPGMNDEGHALIACHEMGHILGGTPRMKIPQFLWASAEGQSDYFASAKCLPKFFAKIKIENEVSGTAYTLCRTKFEKKRDFLACLGTMKGIEAFSHVLSHLSQYEVNPSLDTPSALVIPHTLFDSYPDPQCRLDTLVRGALKLPRPLCWFRTERAQR